MNTKSGKTKGKIVIKSRKHSTPHPSLTGIREFLNEINRISYKPGLACFCTPGHNRGVGF